MRFFDRQRIDAAGNLAVPLQKGLIFLMILSAIPFFFGYHLQSLLSLLLLGIGFRGAYKRRTCLLAIYFWINIALIVFSVVAVIYASTYAANHSDVDYNGDYSSSGSSSTDNSVQPMHAKLFQRYWSWGSNVTTGNSTILPQPSSTSSETISEDNSMLTGLIVLLVIVFVLSAIVTFCKILTIVLSWKMRRLLIATQVATNQKSCSSTTSHSVNNNVGYPGYSPLNSTAIEMESNTSIAAPSPDNSVQQPMMYMPYDSNMMNQMQMQNMMMMNQMQMPNMMMNQYGQPIFFSYQPVPQQEQTYTPKQM